LTTINNDISKLCVELGYNDIAENPILIELIKHACIELLNQQKKKSEHFDNQK